jgi:NTP pyrophosphatase (non-canonical NTP hydrolase)
MKISQLMNAQVLRNDTDFAEACRDWTLADWSNAMCGEAGEAANEVKKFRRGDYSGELLLFQSKLGKEIADVFAYALILAHKAGLAPEYVERIIVEKFNEVSVKVESAVRLTDDGELIRATGLTSVRLSQDDLKTGLLVRYGSGSTALMRLHKPHAGGWHGDQCMGGTTFSSGPFYSLGDDDRSMWDACARWRKP